MKKKSNIDIVSEFYIYKQMLDFVECCKDLDRLIDRVEEIKPDDSLENMLQHGTGLIYRKRKPKNKLVN